MQLMQGRFSIESRPKRGTTIHARVPLSSGRDSMRAPPKVSILGVPEFAPNEERRVNTRNAFVLAGSGVS